MTSKVLTKGDAEMRIAMNSEVGIGYEGQLAKARNKRIETYKRKPRSHFSAMRRAYCVFTIISGSPLPL